MKIKMTTSAITDKGRYYHNYVYEVGVGIDKDLAEAYVKANFAIILEDVKQEPMKSPEPTKKKKKKETNED